VRRILIASAFAALLIPAAMATSPARALTRVAPARATEPVPPVIEVESPPVLAPLAERIRGFDLGKLAGAMRMIGLELPGPPIRVILAPEGSAAAREAPSWAAGYAFGRDGIVVLIPSRSPNYPDDTLEGVLHHEIAHVLIDRAAHGRPIPRWFHEGVAMAAARDWGMEDRTRLMLEMLPGHNDSLDKIDGLFSMGEGRAHRAYALSGAFVRDLLRRDGATFPGEILQRVAAGLTFDEAFVRVTGMTLQGATASFYGRQNLWNRWVPLITSTFTLWTGITLLALWAIRKRRRRDALRREEWALEEAWDLPSESERGPKTWVN
jgi:hypothetical protein